MPDFCDQAHLEACADDFVAQHPPSSGARRRLAAVAGDASVGCAIDRDKLPVDTDGHD
jgi:hypothetical protein